MTTQHPITPPPELTDKWSNLPLITEEIFVIAARWGADQELEACCEWLLANARFLNAGWIEKLRSARRPKPPSLKEQAMQAWCRFQDSAHTTADDMMGDFATIRRALEALDD